MTVTLDKIKSQRFLVWVLLFAFVTALSRYVFAHHTTVFNRAFEQIAWQYLVDDCVESGISIEALIPSNTDSGMLAFSLFAILLQLVFHTSNAIAVTFCIWMAVSITLQVVITDKIFDRKTAILFLLWNLAASPILWPLNAAYFGSQTALSLFPFLLLLLFSSAQLQRSVVVHTALVSAAVCFSLQNAVLVPAYCVIILFSRLPDKKNRAIVFSLLCFAIVIVYYTFLAKLLHQSVPGPVQFLGITSSFITDLSSLLVNFVLIFSEVLPKGVFLYTADTLFNYGAYWLLLIVVLIATAFYLKEGRNLSIQRMGAALTVLIFVVISACNSSTAVDAAKFNFFSLRAFAYILPLFFVVMLYALNNSFSLGKKLAYSLLVVCGYYSYIAVSHFEPISAQSHKPAAWLLAKSLGTKPKVLLRISNRADISKKNDLMYGYAWGIAAATLKDTRGGDTVKLRTLKETLSKFGEGNNSALLEGINTAFANGVTPVLDPFYLAPLQEHLTKHSQNHESDL